MTKITKKDNSGRDRSGAFLDERLAQNEDVKSHTPHADPVGIQFESIAKQPPGGKEPASLRRQMTESEIEKLDKQIINSSNQSGAFFKEFVFQEGSKLCVQDNIVWEESHEAGAWATELLLLCQNVETAVLGGTPTDGNVVKHKEEVVSLGMTCGIDYDSMNRSSSTTIFLRIQLLGNIAR